MSVPFALVVIVILLGVNALLAFSEAAILNARKSVLRERAEDGDRAAVRLLQLLESPSHMLATIQVARALAGFFAAAVGAYCLVGPLRDRFAGGSLGPLADHAGFVAFVVVIALLACFNIVFGELLPRQIAIARADSLAAVVVGPILTLATVLRPLVRLLIAITNAILRLFGNPAAASMPHVTHAEIMALVESAADEGLVEEGQADLVEDALTFGGTYVRNVMVPRVDVECVEGSATLGEAIDIFFRTGFSRLPVYRDTPDDVLGMLYIKDSFRLTWSEPESAGKPVSGFLRPAYFVPETKPIDELLLELRERRTHAAVVVDEYGGMAGLVTLEDVLEELVGEISDEFDPGYEPYRETEPGVYEVDGRVSLNDLADLLDLDRDDLASEDVESVGGLIADRLGRMPEEGDVAEDGPLRFEVRSMDGYRVALARVELIPSSSNDLLDAPILEEP